MVPSVAPPTPQEIQRKLSVHSASPLTTSAIGGPSPSNISGINAAGTSNINASLGAGGGGGPISGTESDSDSVLTPDLASTHAGLNPASTSLMQPPLSSIAERSPGSGGEDSDEEEEDGAGWRAANEAAKDGIGIIGAGGQLRGADVVLMSGYLSKKGERRKTWKKRWFVLRPTHLAFYKTEAEYKLLRLLDLNDVHSCIPVQLKRHANVFGLILPKRTYYLQAGSPEEVQNWVQAIEDARQNLMATSTQNSGNNPSVPIPIPQTPTTRTNFTFRPPSLSASPQQQPNAFSQLVSSSDSEDALSQFAPPPPPGGGGKSGGGGGGGGGFDRGGGLVAPSPANVTFSPSPTSKTAPTPTEGPKILLSGYLMKCGSKRRSWRKRWFVLTPEKLFYCRSHMDTKPHRVFSFSDILGAMDYDLPTHRSSHHHHQYTANILTPSLSTSSPPHLGSSGTMTGYTAGLHGTTPTTAGGVGPTATTTGTPNLHPAVASSLGGSGGGALLDLEAQPPRNFTFKIVMTKRNLLLCAPSEEDEIKWLGTVIALIARRSGPQVQQQQQQQQAGNASVTDSGGGGIKGKVRRLSTGAGVLGGGGGGSGGARANVVHSLVGASGAGAGGGVVGDEMREMR